MQNLTNFGVVELGQVEMAAIDGGCECSTACQVGTAVGEAVAYVADKVESAYETVKGWFN